MKAIAIIIGIVVIVAVAALAGLAALGTALLIGKISAALGIAAGVSATAISATNFALVGVVVKCVVAGATVAGMYVASSWYGDVAVFPMYKISPQEIFENKIGILNPNFFSSSSSSTNNNENTNKFEVNMDTEITNKQLVDTYSTGAIVYNSQKESEATNAIISKMEQYGYSGSVDINYKANASTSGTRMVLAKWSKDNEGYEADLMIYSAGASSSAAAADVMCTAQLEIYKGEYPGSVEAIAATPIANELKPIIAKWYYALRNMALILMMTELVYIGIRIMLCSVASEKAKYKNMLKDWVVAICLLFVMHYIMAFATNLVDSFTNIVSTLAGDHKYIIEIEDENGAIKKAMEEDGISIEYGEGNIIAWDAGNLMGIARMQAAIQSSEVPGVSYIGYTIAFIVLVFYTVFFLFTYLKRLIYLTFLTIIAPMVAFTYPLDKINDGKAQAFDMWLKEYIFNLLIQPFHLILYTVLITSAFDLASKNILYTLVAIGFMMPAEKLLRKFFGFEKAQTPGMLGGAAGAALVMSGMNRLLHGKPPRPSKDGGSGNEKIKENENLGDITSNEGIDNSTLFEGMSTEKGLTENIEKNKPNPNTKQNQEEETKRRLINPSQTTTKEEAEKQKQLEILHQTAAQSSKSTATQPKGNSKPQIPTTRKINTSKAKRRKPSTIRGLKAVGKAYGKQQFKRAVKGGGKFINKMPRMAAGAALGVGAGIVGAAVGITSGDLGKVAQYGGAGIAGGYALGSNLADFAGGIVSVDNEQLKHEYERAYYGSEDEYKRAKLEERRKKYIENEKNIKEIQNYLNCDENTARQTLEKYSDCIDAGITDTKDIATISRAVDSGWSKSKAMTAAKISKKVGGDSPKDLVGDAERDWHERARKIVEKEGITGEKNIESAIKQTDETLNDFAEFKKGLTKM